MALSGEGANLLPVGDEFVLLQEDLRGVLWVRLLQAFRITAKCVNLIQKNARRSVNAVAAA